MTQLLRHRLAGLALAAFAALPLSGAAFAQTVTTPGLPIPIPISKGGTGATTANGAMTGLFSCGSVAVSTPCLNMTQTWNNAGVVFTGIQVDITDTASSATSLLLNLQVGGASKMQVAKSGTISVLGANINIKGDANSLAWGASSDVMLTRDAANLLAQRRGVSAQGLRIYNTYTDASNYERGSADWNITANEFIIGTEAAGTGTLRAVRIAGGLIGFRTAGATRWQIDGSGNFLAQTDNTYDIGASGASRPRAIYVSGLVNSPGYYFPSNGGVTSTADGVFMLRNNAGTDFSRLMFGGSTSSFPALKRSSTSLQVRLADDSNYSNIAADYVWTQPHSVAGLVSAVTLTAGARSFVTDATQTISAGLGTVVVGGGSNKVPVYSDGANWIIGANDRTAPGAANDNAPGLRIGLNFAA